MATVVVSQTRVALSVEDDLPDAWRRLIENLENVAGFPKRLDASVAPTVDEITRIINPAKCDPTTKAEVKKIFAKAMKCVQRFGGMIAQGTSVVFGPSNQVFNALNFLVTVAQDTQEVFDNLTALMERLAAFLERLNYRLGNAGADEKLPKDMRVSVYRVLEQFVTIMALSYKLTHTWAKEENRSLKEKWDGFKAKTKTFVKVGAFGSDSGVKAAIVEFERLVVEVTGAQIDSIHRNLSAAARNICDIGDEVHTMNLTVQESAIATKETHSAVLESVEVTQEMNTTVNDLRSRSDDDRDLKTVREALGILEKDSQLCETADNDYTKQIAGTGNWLFNREEFRKWMNVWTYTDSKSNVLALQGPEGFGKSYLCHALIHRLQREYRTSSNVATCWYYFPKDTKKTSMSSAMWHIIWQLAKADKKFLKHLKTVCSDWNPSDRDDTIRNWNRLVVDYGNKSPASTFFVILDGLDQADIEEQSLLTHMIQQSISSSNDPEELRVQFFISGRDTSIDQLQDNVNRPFLSTNLKASTGDRLDQFEDLERYVAARLNEMKKFQGTLSAEQERLKSRILERFPASSHGNYNVLKRKLNDIANSTKPSEVNVVLERIDESNDDDLERSVRSLNDKLPGPNIKQLNEILLWVSRAKGNIDAHLLNDMLSTTFGEEKLYDPVAFIKQDCSKLLDCNNEEPLNLKFPSSDVETYLRKAPPMRDIVPRPQIDMIQTMLRTSFQTTFGGLEYYNNFDFDQFFEEKRHVQTTLVHLDADVHNDTLKLLEYCLDAICDAQDSEGAAGLLDYAKDYFDEHLTEADADKTMPDQKQRVGQRLFRALKEDALIDRWATEEAVWSMLEWFEEENGFCAAAIKWLKHEDVLRSIQSMTADTAWLNDVTPEQFAGLPVLQHVVRRVLHHWYTQDTFSMASFKLMQYRWLRGYFQKSGPCDEYRASAWYSDASVQELQRWETWARGELSSEHNEAQWHLLMASIFWCWGFDNPELLAEACKRCDEAVQSDSGKWQAQVFKGEVLRDMEDYEQCIDHLEHVVQENVALLENDEKYDTAYWETVIPTIADCHMKLHRFSTAAEWYRKIVDRALEKDDLTKHDQSCCLIRALIQQRAFSDSLQLLRILDSRRQDGKSMLRAMLENPYNEVHQHVVTLAHRAGVLADMEAYYQQAILSAGGSEQATVSFLEFRRLILHWHCGPAISRASIITEWETLMDSVKGNGQAEFTMRISLAQAFLDLARTAGFRSSDTEMYITRLNSLVQKHKDVDVWLPFDIKIILARLLSLSGNVDGARDLLRDEVRKAIKQAREEEDPREGYQLLAFVFPLFDDDVNANAAWLLLEPTREPNQSDKHNKATTTAGEDRLASENSCVIVDGGIESNTIEATPNDDTAQTIPSKTLIAKDKKKLRGVIYFSCDGDCGRKWRFADDMYICKDCLCVQLDSTCYKKLKAGALDPTICGPDHEHLYIPPFDIEAWQELDPKMMRLGDAVVEREQWLKDVERDWNLEVERVVVVDSVDHSEERDTVAGLDTPAKTPAN